jgi:hypothetical protein
MRSCLYVNHKQILNQLVDFYEIRHGGHAVEGDIDAVLLNPVTSTIPERRTFRLLRFMQNLQQPIQRKIKFGNNCDHTILP